MNKNDWQNPQFLQKGREKDRAFYIPFSDLDSALTVDKENSKYYRCLNGTWDLNFIRPIMKYQRLLQTGTLSLYHQTGKCML